MTRVREAADKAAQEAARKERLRKMTGVVYSGDLLGPGEMPNSHQVRVENLIGSDNTDRFVFDLPSSNAYHNIDCI